MLREPAMADNNIEGADATGAVSTNIPPEQVMTAGDDGNEGPAETATKNTSAEPMITIDNGKARGPTEVPAPTTPAPKAQAGVHLASDRLTILTAIAAIGATIFSGLQWWEAHSGGEDVKMQVQAAKALADAAHAQVVISGRLLDTSEEQARAAQKEAAAALDQADTGKKLLIVEGQTADAQAKVAATTRSVSKPELSVNGIGLIGFSNFGKITGGIVDTSPIVDANGNVTIYAKVHFMNIGGSQAEITYANVGIYFGHVAGARAFPPVEAQIRPNNAPPKGEFDVGWVQFSIPKSVADEVYGKNLTILTYGSVAYTDTLGSKRKTCFAYSSNWSGSPVSSGPSQAPGFHCAP